MHLHVVLLRVGQDLSLTGLLTTTMYDPDRVAANLGLAMDRMPLLASLLSTDYISRKDLGSVHAELLRSGKVDLLGLARKLTEIMRRKEVELRTSSLLLPEKWDDDEEEGVEVDDPALVKAIVEELCEGRGLCYIHVYVLH